MYYLFLSPHQLGIFRDGGDSELEKGAERKPGVTVHTHFGDTKITLTLQVEERKHQAVMT